VAIQTATTGSLENAQNIIVAECRYTQEHNAPCRNLVEQFKLAKGQKQMTVPKVGQMDASDLTDGVDLVASEAIGMTTTDLTAAEVGLKVILTDKLVRQENDDMFRVVGRQMGDAMARKVDKDIIELFDGFSTSLGLDGSDLLTKSAAGCVAYARASKFPQPISFVHHPNAIAFLCQQSAAIGMTYYAGIMPGLSEDLLRDFWKIKMGGVNFFEDGNIEKTASVDSGKGAIFSKSALCYIESLAPNTERERDASLRAWEIVVVSDYGVFELDDNYGAECIYEIGTLATTS
jgi:hypothetical protein